MNNSTPESKRKQTVLSDKRSLMINIFLKQFKVTPQEITGYISAANASMLTLDHVKSARQILLNSPRGIEDEIDLVTNLVHTVGVENIDNAEQFLHYSSKIDNYALILELMEAQGSFEEYFRNVQN